MYIRGSGDVDESTLLGFGYSNSRDSLLIYEGMAEHLWDKFFSPIQKCNR